MQKRTPFPVPLAKIALSFDEMTGRVGTVRVSFEGSDDAFLVTPLADTMVHITPKGREKTVYRETGDGAQMVSDFEADVLRKTVRSLMATLDLFERDLKEERWDKCLYLDSFFPRFLRGFYYLCDAVRNSQETLPKTTRIPESAFDVSLNSPKSDERVNSWRAHQDHALKLRIISKELAFQLKDWDEKTLGSKKRDSETFFDPKFKEAYTLFVKLYFNIKPFPDVPANGGHL